MYLVLGLAAAAAAVILLYSRRREGGEDITDSWVGRAKQLTAVVLVLSQAVEGLVTALEHATRTSTAGYAAPSGYPRGWGSPRMTDVFEQEDWR